MSEDDCLPMDPDVTDADLVPPAPRPGPDVLAVIAVGGALGSVARWGLSQLFPPDGGFPWATFDANVSGCLLIGVLMTLIVDLFPPSRYLRPFLGVGVLGGYTTFSTYLLDVRNLLASGAAGTAAGYLVGSLLAGTAAVWVGIGAVRAVLRVRRWGAFG